MQEVEYISPSLIIYIYIYIYMETNDKRNEAWKISEWYQTQIVFNFLLALAYQTHISENTGLSTTLDLTGVCDLKQKS